MECERRRHGKRAGEEQQGGGEVSGGPFKLADDDRPGKSATIADGVDQREPAAGSRSAATRTCRWVRRCRGWPSDKASMTRVSGPVWADQARAVPATNSGSATCQMRSPVASEWRPAITM